MSYTTAPDPQQPPPLSERPGVFAFQLAGKTLFADSVKAFVALQDRVDELNTLLLDLSGGPPTTPQSCESWTRVIALARQVFGLPQLALDESGASDHEVLGVLVGYFIHAGLAAPSPPPEAQPELATAPVPTTEAKPRRGRMTPGADEAKPPPEGGAEEGGGAAPSKPSRPRRPRAPKFAAPGGIVSQSFPDVSKLTDAVTRLTDAVQGLRQQFAAPPVAHSHAAGATVPFQMPVPRGAVPVRPMGAAAMATGGLGFTPPGLSVTGGVGVAPPQPPTPPAVPPAATVAMDPGRLAAARQIFYSKALAKQASRAKFAQRDLEELRNILGESESDLYKAVVGKVGKGIPDEGTLRMLHGWHPDWPVRRRGGALRPGVRAGREQGKLSPDNPWSRYLLEVSQQPLRPSRPVP